VSVVGNDYEGIHTLSTLTSATSRPLLSAFNNVNRIKLGAQKESYELRVRIDQLATTAQKFTARVGLVDISTIGVPTNGVIFSYDPVYPVTAVAQIVTATPVVTSKIPTQVFTQTLNSSNYTYTYQTYQVITIAITQKNNTTYTVTINGVPYSYLSDSSATQTEISTGLKAAINADSGCPATASGTTSVILTGKVLGASWTYSVGANLVATDTTATPVATTIVSALIALINSDGPLPITASGTSTLIMTADVAGTAFTYSGTANLTEVLTQPNVPEVLYSGNWIASVINSSSASPLDTGVAVVAGTWYRLKAICAANGLYTSIYINDIYMGTITATLPSAAMRYVFKIEKTLGTTPCTCSIDYITWRRTRDGT
jgi:hypothetical protein